MGREIKRVPLDFDWPLHQVWAGYVGPYHGVECQSCDGTGYSPDYRDLELRWYGRDGQGPAWMHHLEQSDVDALIEAKRLRDLTRNGHVPTVDEVNAWSHVFLGHDGINSWICIEARCKREGREVECLACRGKGEFWASPEIEQLAENWERMEPPVGEGWQVWETVSEGSPISPVFATAGDLVDWLVAEGYSRMAAQAFAQSGFAMSAMMVNGHVYQDIEALAHIEEDR